MCASSPELKVARMRTQLHRLTAMAGVFVLLTLTGCNTVQGLGKDIEKGGEAIQKVAK